MKANLFAWLKESATASTSSVEEARAALAALPPEQQRIFLRPSVLR